MKQSFSKTISAEQSAYLTRKYEKTKRKLKTLVFYH